MVTRNIWNSNTFTDLTEYLRFQTAFTSDDIVEEVTVESVSSSYFSMLGVTPAMGRPLLPEDDADTAELVAVVSNNMWQSRFAGTGDILNRTVSVNGLPTRIVGVAPQGFVGIDLDYLSSPKQALYRPPSMMHERRFFSGLRSRASESCQKKLQVDQKWGIDLETNREAAAARSCGSGLHPASDRMAIGP